MKPFESAKTKLRFLKGEREESSKLVKLGNCQPEESKREIRLGIQKYVVFSIIFMFEPQMIVVARLGGIEVYDPETLGNPNHIFHNHKGSVNDVAQISESMVASVDESGQLITWNVRSAEQICDWEHNASLKCVKKRDSGTIVVMSAEPQLFILKHESGREFKIVHRFLQNPTTFTDSKFRIRVSGNYIFSSHGDFGSMGKVWNLNSFEEETSLYHTKVISCVDMNQYYCIIASTDKYSRLRAKLYVYEVKKGFSLNVVLWIKLNSARESVECVSILSEDHVAVCTNRRLLFITLSTRAITSDLSLNHNLTNFAILSNGKISIGGDNGYCAIVQPPRKSKLAIEEYISSEYPNSVISAGRRAPLRSAWNATQSKHITYGKVCTTLLNAENCSRSLDEWCFAHSILLEAVRCGDIPRSPHFGNSIAHWYIVLYQHCAKLAIGEKDISFLTFIFWQAEEHRLVEKGAIQNLIDMVNIRSDIENGNRFIVHAVYQIFLRQAEVDERLRKIIDYQELQQLTALLNSILGFIPIGGSILANVVTGGAEILHDLQVDGLVESLMGSTIDLSENVSLVMDEWSKLSYEKKKIVIDIAHNLGLTVEELEEKLLSISRISIEGIPIFHRESIKKKERDIVQSKDLPALKKEIIKWKEMGVGKTRVGKLKTKEVASSLAAFLTNYEQDRIRRFAILKNEFSHTFQDKIVFGLSFANSDDEGKRQLKEIVISVLERVSTGEVLAFEKTMVQKFINESSRSQGFFGARR